MRKLKNSELNRISPKEFKEAKKSSVIVILDNIRSLNNIGSIFSAKKINEIICSLIFLSRRFL